MRWTRRTPAPPPCRSRDRERCRRASARAFRAGHGRWPSPAAARRGLASLASGLPLLRGTSSARRGVNGARAGAQRSGRLARRKAKRVGVPQVSVDGGDDHTCFDGDEVDADERHAHPSVDDDALVQDAVEHIDETRTTRTAFYDRHLLTPFCLELSLELRDPRLETRDVPGADAVSLARAAESRLVPPPVEAG